MQKLIINIEPFFLQYIISNEYSMILKNNRFFGRDISNIAPSIARNQSQQLNQKHQRRHSLSLIEPHQKPNLQPTQSTKNTSANQKLNISDLPQNIKTNHQCVPQYFIEAFHYMRANQKLHIGNYCQKTINVDKFSRGEVINWIIEVHHKFKLFPQTLFIIIYILDKYLSLKNVQKNKLKLVAISALYMAAKYEETYKVPQIKDLLNLCSYSYTKRDILETQADIIKVLNFDLIYDPSYKFLEALQIYSQINKKNFHLAQYLLQLALTQSEFLEYSQSMLASSAFYLVCKIRKVQIDWQAKYQNLTNYKQCQLHKCARELCNLLERIQKINHISSLKKKFSESEFHEVTRLKLERKK